MAILNVDAAFVTLDAGVPTTLLNAATATGTGQPFTVQPRADGSARTIQFQAIIAGAPTTATVDLQVSLDGGTTWSNLTAGLLTQATLVATSSNLAGGSVYRLNLSALAGGTAPAVTVNASAS